MAQGQIQKVAQLILNESGVAQVDAENDSQNVRNVGKLFPQRYDQNSETLDDVLRGILKDLPPLANIGDKAVSAASRKLQANKSVSTNKISDRSLMGYQKMAHELTAENNADAKHAFSVVAEYAKLHYGGYLPSCHYHQYAIAQLICLKKPAGGLRPIVVASRELYWLNPICISGPTIIEKRSCDCFII